MGAGAGGKNLYHRNKFLPSSPPLPTYINFITDGTFENGDADWEFGLGVQFDANTALYDGNVSGGFFTDQPSIGQAIPPGLKNKNIILEYDVLTNTTTPEGTQGLYKWTSPGSINDSVLPKLPVTVGHHVHEFFGDGCCDYIQLRYFGFQTNIGEILEIDNIVLYTKDP